MFIRNRRAALIALSGVFLVTTAAIRLPGNAARNRESDGAPRAAFFKPGALPVDAILNVGHANNVQVRVLVRRMQRNNEFNAPVAFTMKSSNGNDACQLYISTTVGSYSVPKMHDPANKFGFIVGVITNPNDCKPLAFNLGVKDSAAWYVHYTLPTAIGSPGVAQDGVGQTGLILLQRNGATHEDDWFPQARSWNLGYCNHATGGTVDAALVLSYAERCSAPIQYKHNTDVMSAAMSRAAKDKTLAAYRLLPGANDLALWFACGGDCCYSSFQ
jgi:hypothetical protein